FVLWGLLCRLGGGGFMVAFIRRGTGGVLVASALLILLGLSGALDLARASDASVSSYEFTDTKGLQVADWVRHNTRYDAVFAVADEHNSPIPTLGGRRVMSGYPGWLWTEGLRDLVHEP